jgi:hypothetical protein
LRGLIREYLFVSLFRVCAESLAGENASRHLIQLRGDRDYSRPEVHPADLACVAELFRVSSLHDLVASPATAPMNPESKSPGANGSPVRSAGDGRAKARRTI